MSDENKEQLNQEESEVVDELRRQQLLDNHAVKMEQLKSKFLQEKIIKDRKNLIFFSILILFIGQVF